MHPPDISRQGTGGGVPITGDTAAMGDRRAGTRTRSQGRASAARARRTVDAGGGGDREMGRPTAHHRTTAHHPESRLGWFDFR